MTTGWAIWIRGAADGRSRTIARGAADTLLGRGVPVRLLALEHIERALLSEARHTESERDVLHRALGLMAALLAEGGLPTMIETTSDRREWRDLARAAIPRFAEVWLAGPEADRRKEQPETADLVIVADSTPVADAVERLVALAQALEEAGPQGEGVRPAEPEEPPHEDRGWAIWITGRPGSGKTSVAERVAHALTAQGVTVRVLGAGALRHFLLREPQASETEQEVAHRALVQAAKHLTDAGAAVIVDSTAPRRAWRDAARSLIPRFAEVQLLCSKETCVERERAARWGLGLHQPMPGALRAPDAALDYEESERAELTLFTDAHDLWTTAEQVLFLARRLQRTA